MIVSPTSTKPSRQLYVVLFIFLSLIILVACIWLYQAEVEEIKHDNYAALASMGEGKVEQLRQWRRERILDVSRDSRSPRLIDGMEKLAKDPHSTSAREQILDILGIIRRGGQYARSTALDPSGKVLLDTGEGPFTVDPAVLDAARSIPGGGFLRCSAMKRGMSSSTQSVESGAVGECSWVLWYCAPVRQTIYIPSSNTGPPSTAPPNFSC